MPVWRLADLGPPRRRCPESGVDRRAGSTGICGCGSDAAHPRVAARFAIPGHAGGGNAAPAFPDDGPRPHPRRGNMGGRPIHDRVACRRMAARCRRMIRWVRSAWMIKGATGCVCDPAVAGPGGSRLAVGTSGARRANSKLRIWKSPWLRNGGFGKSGGGFSPFGWLAWVAACVRSWPGIPVVARAWRVGHLAADGDSFCRSRAMENPACDLSGFSARPRNRGIPGTAPGCRWQQTAETSPRGLTSGRCAGTGQNSRAGKLRFAGEISGWPKRTAAAARLPAVRPDLGDRLSGRKKTRAVSRRSCWRSPSRLAQIAFGYGFDWVDVFDLASDADRHRAGDVGYRIARYSEDAGQVGVAS